MSDLNTATSTAGDEKSYQVPLSGSMTQRGLVSSRPMMEVKTSLHTSRPFK